MPPSLILSALSLLIMGAALGYLFGFRQARKQSRDPWLMQRRLMEISPNQELPEVPTITGTSLLYFALILEEAAELGYALDRELRSAAINSSSSDSIKEWGGNPFGDLIYSAASRMKHFSVLLRMQISSNPFAARAISREGARGILDGITDIAVVTCGFSAAAGLPGSAAFGEVTDSNLSKADPMTGRIESDPSGKWIKGPNYREPSLDRVLDAQSFASDY